jgi:hypothetical protein
MPLALNPAGCEESNHPSWPHGFAGASLPLATIVATLSQILLGIARFGLDLYIELTRWLVKV